MILRAVNKLPKNRSVITSDMRASATYFVGMIMQRKSPTFFSENGIHALQFAVTEFHYWSLIFYSREVGMFEMIKSAITR
jgi:hypothetical protein